MWSSEPTNSAKRVPLNIYVSLLIVPSLFGFVYMPMLLAGNSGPIIKNIFRIAGYGGKVLKKNLNIKQTQNQPKKQIK